MSLKIKSAAGLLLAGILSGLLPVSVLGQDNQAFSDLDSGATPYVQAIEYLRDAGVVEGYADGTFKPSASINRAEFVKILIGAYTDGELSGSNCFPDVREDWYAPYVCTAKKMGVIEGYPDGTFKPADPINFAEAAKIIANTFGLNQGESDPSVWFRQYIEALQREKAIPLSVEYFDEEITRDEMSEIIWRIKADINDKASRTYLELNGQGLVTVATCSELDERLQSIGSDYPIMYDRGFFEEGMPADGEMAIPEAAPSMTKSSEGLGAGADEYSTTNIQEAGVDEADIIKNDGRYIYLIKNSTIRIIDAYPASNMKELINFQLGPQDEYFYPSEMYLNGNQLVVLGTASMYYPMSLDGGTAGTDSDESLKSIAPYYGGDQSKVYLVDISDRSKPKVTRTIDFDGSYTTSRRVGNTLYLVLNKYPYFPYYRTDGESFNISDYLPKMSDSQSGKVELVASCDQIRLMPKPRQKNFLIAAAVPLADPAKKVSRSVIVGSGENVYASTDNLYVASTDWSGPYWHGGGQQTKLYRFALSDGQIDYRSEGLVPGTVLNQFSMDEHRGNFRIATTQDAYSNGTSKTTNNLYVLDSGLKTLGRLENVAPGERIYSVRFLGDRAYMVTFKYIDPLFAIDLSDPSAPKILGELKIPGYSDYLHPYDENHLIGFGKDVDPDEAANDQDFVYYTAVKGFKMGLFDVTDPGKPKELFSEIIGDQGTYSELLYNHKALLFDKEKNLIAFPISETRMPEGEVICSDFTYSTCPSSCSKVCQPKCTYEDGITICDSSCDGPNSCQNSSWVYPETVFVGAYVYGLDLQKGFQLKGKITHLTSAEMEDLLRNGYANWEKTIQRIIYMGNTLYTVSQGAVKANDLASSLREINYIELAGSIYNLKFGSDPVLE